MTRSGFCPVALATIFIEMRPIERNALTLRESIVKKQFLMPTPVLVDEARHLHIEAAVFGDIEEADLPATNELHRVPQRFFVHPQSGIRDRVEAEPMTESLFHIEHEISRVKFRAKIEDRVSHQNMVIEIENVESNHEISAAQALDQLVHARFAENFVATCLRAVDDADRHPHIAFPIPPAGVIRSPLCFEINVNYVARH